MYMARIMFKIVLIVELFGHKRGKQPSLRPIAKNIIAANFIVISRDKNKN